MSFPGHVYVLDFGDRTCKIGRSKNPRGRWLSSFSEAKLAHVTGLIDSPGIVEKDAHRQLTEAGKHLHGEFFGVGAREAIQAVKTAEERLRDGILQAPRDGFVSFTIPEDVLEVLDDWIAEHPAIRSRTGVAEVALRQYLTEQTGVDLIKEPKPRVAHNKTDPEKLEAAKEIWHGEDYKRMTNDEVAKATGVSKVTMHREFGPRGRKAGRPKQNA